MAAWLRRKEGNFVGGRWGFQADSLDLDHLIPACSHKSLVGQAKTGDEVWGELDTFHETQAERYVLERLIGLDHCG